MGMSLLPALKTLTHPSTTVTDARPAPMKVGESLSSSVLEKALAVHYTAHAEDFGRCLSSLQHSETSSQGSLCQWSDPF